jgi:hypothetical protein
MNDKKHASGQGRDHIRTLARHRDLRLNLYG